LPANRKRSKFNKLLLKIVDLPKKGLIGELTGCIVVAVIVTGVIVDNAESGSYRTSAEKDDSLESFIEKEELEGPYRGLFFKVQILRHKYCSYLFLGWRVWIVGVNLTFLWNNLSFE